MCKVSEGLQVKTILRFEDNGQDFLEWHLNEFDEVIDVKPKFQKSVWEGHIVVDYEEGESPVYVNRYNGDANQLIHKVEEVKTVVTRK